MIKITLQIDEDKVCTKRRMNSLLERVRVVSECTLNEQEKEKKNNKNKDTYDYIRMLVGGKKEMKKPPHKRNVIGILEIASLPKKFKKMMEEREELLYGKVGTKDFVFPPKNGTVA